MRLRLSTTAPSVPELGWGIESPTPGVVLINVSFTSSPVLVPLHWRAGNWRKPPLDIRLDTKGRLQSLQFVLQDERVARGDPCDFPEPEVEMPIFNVQEWPRDRYVDEHVSVSSKRFPKGELSLQIGQEHGIDRAYMAGPGALFAFGPDAELSKIRLGPFSKDDWDSIDAFSITPP